MPVRVDAGRDQGVDTDRTAALADLQHQGNRGDERERSRVVQPTGAEGLEVLVEGLGHLGHMRLDQPRDPQRLQQLSLRRVETPSREHVAITLARARSARLRRSSSHPGKHLPVLARGLGTARFSVPVRVSNFRARYPLRRFVPSGQVVPCAAPQTAPVSALISVLMNTVSSSRSKSGLASASCTSMTRAGPIRVVTVIVVSFFESFFESVVRAHSKDHAMAVATCAAKRSPASRTPLCRTQPRPLREESPWCLK